MAVILFGLEVVVTGIAAIIRPSFRDAMIEIPNIAWIMFAGFGMISVATLILKLLAVRFAIEVGLRVLRPQNPESLQGSETSVAPATAFE